MVRGTKAFFFFYIYNFIDNADLLVFNERTFNTTLTLFFVFMVTKSCTIKTFVFDEQSLYSLIFYQFLEKNGVHTNMLHK